MSTIIAAGADHIALYRSIVDESILKSSPRIPIVTIYAAVVPALASANPYPAALKLKSPIPAISPPSVVTRIAICTGNGAIRRRITRSRSSTKTEVADFNTPYLSSCEVHVHT